MTKVPVALGRFYFLLVLTLLGSLAVITRLFYWQVIAGVALQAVAQDQYQKTQVQTGVRGTISTADGYLLVGNQPMYRVFAEPPLLKDSPAQIAQLLSPLLVPELEEYQVATTAAELETLQTEFTQKLTTKLENKDSKWVALATKVTEPTKQKITALEISGLGFDAYSGRYYPEASLAAQLTGFVGKNEAGDDIGYFGVEGALDKELRPRSIKTTFWRDAFGRWLFGSSPQLSSVDGRSITLTIRRDMQQAVEELLQRGIEKYQASSGEVIVMEPQTGRVLAAAAFPSYAQATFYRYPPELYAFPGVASSYEPGSTFKTLTVAAGIETKAITPDTQCPVCDGPRQIDKYTIKTWNNQYTPQITMTEALAKSDNTAMIFIVDQLGKDRFLEFLHSFGVGEKTHIDLQEDSTPPFPSKWGPVELATASFGQGVSVTSLQLTRAVGTLANQGVMLQPQVVAKVYDPANQVTQEIKPKQEKTVVSPETAQTVADMMVKSTQEAERLWRAPKHYTIAGKSGTSQVAVNGQYDAQKTIASYVGFSPPNQPKFVMTVKLTEPRASSWATNTAAPLWYEIADRLFLLLNVPPNR